MAINLSKWDVLEHLKTEQDMQGYLNACINEADPKLLAAALDDIERARQINHVPSDAELS